MVQRERGRTAVTIRDVARAAQVHPGTVSRALTITVSGASARAVAAVQAAGGTVTTTVPSTAADRPAT